MVPNSIKLLEFILNCSQTLPDPKFENPSQAHLKLTLLIVVSPFLPSVIFNQSKHLQIFLFHLHLILEVRKRIEWNKKLSHTLQEDFLNQSQHQWECYWKNVGNPS